jgi:hypothetical protein
VKKTSAWVQFISKKGKQDSCWGLPRTDQISMPRVCIRLQVNAAKHVSDRAEGLLIWCQRTQDTHTAV